MLFFYNVTIRLYYILISVASFFNKKAKKWITGRKDVVYGNLPSSVWFHFASLGEFEQGRPVLESYRQLHPEKKIVLTFFSPSGYEIRNNTPLADAVYYLPLDTSANAKKFLNAINPSVAIFTKYEYWYHFFSELYQRRIPLYMISAIFRPDQVFFKWYGYLNRTMLRLVRRFFVQDEQSVLLLTQIGINCVTVSGDTRLDRVYQNAHNPAPLSIVNNFKNKRHLFIAGSTWPTDERLLSTLPTIYPDWAFIFAPHEISEEKIALLEQHLHHGSFVRYSALNEQGDTTAFQTLIIDNVGMLSSLYQYADIAYVGGGFGNGIHNILEAAAFGIPVIFGPNYQRFKEAVDLIALNAATSISDEAQLKDAVALLTNTDHRIAAGEKIAAYVAKNIGATQIIMDHINS